LQNVASLAACSQVQKQAISRSPIDSRRTQGGRPGGGGQSEVCDAMRTCEAGGRRDVSTAEASDRQAACWASSDV